METGWCQNGIQNGSSLENADKPEQNYKTCGILIIQGVPGMPKSIKNRLKFEAQDEVPLGIDF